MKLVIYVRDIKSCDNPTKDGIRNEILSFDDNEGCGFSSNSTCIICSEKFNKYWVESNKADIDIKIRIEYIRDNIISKNFYRRMKFNLDCPGLI